MILALETGPMTTPTCRRRTHPRSRLGRGGFTLIELGIVIVIIGILAALLLPAINGAVRRARDASVNSEINLMAQAMASFKSTYGDYPPSRVLLVESGDYSSFLTGTNLTQPVSTFLGIPAYAGDITVAQLAQRSIQTMRKFWPRAVLGSTAPLPAGAIPGGFYDYNGNGTNDGAYVLDGRECLVFFLGGIRQLDASGNFGMTGFAKDPRNPFANSNMANGSSRAAPLFEFAGNRLKIPIEKQSGTVPLVSGIPAYYDPFQTPGSPVFYAYFSAYGGNYDPNDVNAIDPSNPGSYEIDINNNLLNLTLQVNFPVTPAPAAGNPNRVNSPPPNPYTNSATDAPTSLALSYFNSQSFQIIAAGADAHYGAGGQYTPDATTVLPQEPPPSLSPPAPMLDRTYEKDNLTNFHNGRLE
jgi:prepilin-type N-terminal cleavage/methylation domain-containing protein